jgi:hypothetical protein
VKALDTWKICSQLGRDGLPQVSRAGSSSPSQVICSSVSRPLARAHPPPPRFTSREEPETYGESLEVILLYLSSLAIHMYDDVIRDGSSEEL